MKLVDIMNIEEKLLTFEEKNKFTIEFNDYILLNSLLNSIGAITDNYFKLLGDYNDDIKSIESLEERKNKLCDYNNKLLVSDVDINTEKINLFMAKYNIK